jgi:hypothetical protein
VRRALATVPASLPTGRRRLTNTRGRPWGRPRKLRLSPQCIRCGRARRQRRERRTCRQHRRQPIPWPQVSRRARRQNDGPRSLPPTEPASVPRSEQDSWRERPRCARGWWPRARPVGSLTPWLSLSQSVSTMVSRAARSALCSRVDHARLRPRFPRRTGFVFPENVGPQTRRFHVRFATQTFTGNRPGNRVSCNVNLASFAAAARLMRRPSRRQCCICARHRARRCASLRPRVRAAFGP